MPVEDSHLQTIRLASGVLEHRPSHNLSIVVAQNVQSKPLGVVRLISARHRQTSFWVIGTLCPPNRVVVAVSGPKHHGWISRGYSWNTCTILKASSLFQVLDASIFGARTPMTIDPTWQPVIGHPPVDQPAQLWTRGRRQPHRLQFTPRKTVQPYPAS